MHARMLFVFVFSAELSTVATRSVVLQRTLDAGDSVQLHASCISMACTQRPSSILEREGSMYMYPFTGGEMTDVGPSFILYACSLLKCM